jgi:hypothetical protein
MELDSDHVNGRCATVTKVVEEIAAQGDLYAVGVLLACEVVWNVLVADENDSVGTFADSRDALSKTSGFFM